MFKYNGELKQRIEVSSKEMGLWKLSGLGIQIQPESAQVLNFNLGL